MKFMQEDLHDRFAIQRYDKGQITINGVAYRSSLILTPAEVIPDWRPQVFGELLEPDFSRLIDLRPEMILLGTGASHQFPHPALTVEILQQQIGLDVMDTAAACRTYNILMAEGRKVAAALLMI
ncbi:MAG: Mth938-like domain-containing protein [Gammaproteobacteria bacterium]|nr:Mth938-like domain-containing protein [Gammaproteobacteria bacterium]